VLSRSISIEKMIDSAALNSTIHDIEILLHTQLKAYNTQNEQINRIINSGSKSTLSFDVVKTRDELLNLFDSSTTLLSKILDDIKQDSSFDFNAITKDQIILTNSIVLSLHEIRHVLEKVKFESGNNQYQRNTLISDLGNALKPHLDVLDSSNFNQFLNSIKNRKTKALRLIESIETHLLPLVNNSFEIDKRTTQIEKALEGYQLSSALFTYPALMAADILLYDADFVPVGEDQKQHLELTRDIAARFNNRFGAFFTVPEPLIPEVGARIMDLQDPTKKMSKSEDSDKGCITLYDDRATIVKKIRSAVTDSVGIVRFDPENQPGLANLITIYASLSGLSPQDVVAKFPGPGYAPFKDACAELVADAIGKLQNRYEEVISSGTLDAILDRGRDVAGKVAFRKLEKAKQKIGLGRKR